MTGPDAVALDEIGEVGRRRLSLSMRRRQVRWVPATAYTVDSPAPASTSKPAACSAIPPTPRFAAPGRPVGRSSSLPLPEITLSASGRARAATARRNPAR